MSMLSADIFGRDGYKAEVNRESATACGQDVIICVQASPCITQPFLSHDCRDIDIRTDFSHSARLRINQT